MNEVFYTGTNKEWYLSYMPTAPELAKTLDEIMGSPHVGHPETAICIYDPWQCYILLGDHREHLIKAIGDHTGEQALYACMNYFRRQKAIIGYTSDSIEDFKCPYSDTGTSLEAKLPQPTVQPVDSGTLAYTGFGLRTGMFAKLESTHT